MNVLNKIPESLMDDPSPRRRPGRPKGSATKSRVPIAKPGHESFPNVPVELWNQLASACLAFMRTVGSHLETAYVNGIEVSMVNMMDAILPSAALALGRATMEALAAQERGFRGSNIRCHLCEGGLEYQGDVNKVLKTRIGNVNPRRAYYHGRCGHSAVPLDMLLGVNEVHAVMPSLQDAVALLCASMSYPEAVKMLEVFCPSKFSLKAVETITATVAKQVAKQEASCCENHPGLSGWDGQLTPGVAIAEMDGGFALVRDHTEPSKEFKLALLGRLEDAYLQPITAVGPDKVDRHVKLLGKTYVGTFSDPDTLFCNTDTEYWRRGLYNCQTLHAIFDGAPWIWNRMPLLALGGQELSMVLDWWHADERLAEIANILHGKNTEEAAKWRVDIQADLWDSRLDPFFVKLQAAIDNAETPATQKTLQKQYAYFDARRSLLRYQECRNRGLPIGSGAIEGGIRCVGKDRLCRAGMRWNIRGAEAIFLLRCVKFSNRYDELAEKRAAQRARSYQNAQAAWNQAA